MFFYLWTRFVLIFRLPDLENLRSDQVSITIGHYKRLLKTMFFWPLTLWMTHIRTPRPRLSKVRPSFNYHWSLLRVSKTNVFLTFDPKNDSYSDSLTSITSGPTKFQPSLVTISDFLNRCSFDLKCKQTDRQTDRQTNEFFSYDPPYSRGNKC